MEPPPDSFREIGGVQESVPRQIPADRDDDAVPTNRGKRVKTPLTSFFTHFLCWLNVLFYCWCVVADNNLPLRGIYAVAIREPTLMDEQALCPNLYSQRPVMFSE